jgi:hypothetical protein
MNIPEKEKTREQLVPYATRTALIVLDRFSSGTLSSSCLETLYMGGGRSRPDRMNSSFASYGTPDLASPIVRC